MKVEEFKLGNTTIEIHDDAYVGKTQEDIDNILARIAQIYMSAKLRNTGA
jgi:hypothetical protein